MSVYFIQSGSAGPIKIGYAKSCDRRLRALQTGNPEILTLLAVADGGRREERAVHMLLAAYRHRAEWFVSAPPVLAMVGRALANDLPHVAFAEVTAQDLDAWRLIDETASALGASSTARLKWRQHGRGVPFAWRMRISERASIPFSVFEALPQTPGRIAPPQSFAGGVGK